jgi:hypothetical protein
VTLVADIIKGSVVLPDRREIPEWAAAEVDFGNAEAFKGPFDINNVPWIREMMRAFKDPTVRIVTMIAPPQESGKTKGAEVCLAWRITTAPAKMAFNTSTNVSAQKWQETRWEQMHQAVPAMVKKLSPNPNHKKKGRIIFADKTFLLIQGAETPANRQSDTVEVQINDELHLWERPWVTQMHSRTKAYKDTKKILNISLGGDEGSELHELWTEGCQGEWSHHCPKCSQPFQYVFNNQRPDCNIRFDLTKVIQHADGRLDLTEFDKTVHVVCPRPGCAHRMDYDEEMLVKLNQGGRYVLMNPGASAEKVSLHVNSFAIGRRRWSEILLPWVRMNLRGGIFAPDILRTFICEELAEFWKEKPMVVSSEIRLGSYTRAEILKPGMWQDEWIRVFLGDNQRGSKGDVPTSVVSVPGLRARRPQPAGGLRAHQRVVEIPGQADRAGRAGMVDGPARSLDLRGSPLQSGRGRRNLRALQMVRADGRRFRSLPALQRFAARRQTDAFLRSALH